MDRNDLKILIMPE